MAYLFVDGGNLAARCFFAQKELHTLSGQRSGLVHGFLKSLGAVRVELGVRLENTCVFWDGGRSKRREELYPEYKKGRRLSEPKTEQDVLDAESYKIQTRAVKRLLQTRPLRQVEVAGVEADDLMALLAVTVNDDVIILSRDQDLHQLVNGRIAIYDAEHGILTPTRVAERWQLPQFDKDRILLRRCLEGDKGDNIKGVKGVGPKRAQKVEPYLRLEGRKLLQVIQAEGTTQKLIDRILEEQDVVVRNMDLMRLPTDWAEAFFDVEQAQDAMQQFLEIPRNNWESWTARATEWELEEVIAQAERWV